MPISIVITLPDNIVDRDQRIGEIMRPVLLAKGDAYVRHVSETEDDELPRRLFGRRDN